MRNKTIITIILLLGLTTAGFAAKPDIALNFDGRTIFSGDPISPTPSLEVFITSTVTIDAFLTITGRPRTALTLSKTGDVYHANPAIAALTDGLYIFTVEAFGLGTSATFEAGPLFVQNSNGLILQGPPLAYPNPYNGSGNLAIGYTLSKPANIALNIFDLAGNLINRQSFPAGMNGGLAGYNEITWDGKAASGAEVGNGLYITIISADGQVPPNGKGRITVFR